MTENQKYNRKYIGRETVEEVAIKILQSHPDYVTEGFSEYQNGRFNGIIEGLEFQKQLYSEEEVLEIIRQYAFEEHLITSSKPDIWFEQFKKK